jgi:hypothetical protein
MSNMADVIFNVDLAVDFKAFIMSNLDDISFDDPSLKDTILNADDDDLLRVGKTINSPTNIVSVDAVNADFFRRHLFKNGDKSE